MIADYVNDQIDVVSRAFLGLSVACARCHDHKFDPISTEDYYALAGIFFSTRLVPGPVPGNTPLVRVPLLSRRRARRGSRPKTPRDKRRRAELEQQLPDAADRAYVAFLGKVITTRSAAYLDRGHVNLGEPRRSGAAHSLEAIARRARARREVAGRVGRLSGPGQRTVIDRASSDRARRGGRNAHRATARTVRGAPGKRLGRSRRAEAGRTRTSAAANRRRTRMPDPPSGR